LPFIFRREVARDVSLPRLKTSSARAIIFRRAAHNTDRRKRKDSGLRK